jgi:hypothetical protein
MINFMGQQIVEIAQWAEDFGCNALTRDRDLIQLQCARIKLIYCSTDDQLQRRQQQEN